MTLANGTVTIENSSVPTLHNNVSMDTIQMPRPFMHSFMLWLTGTLAAIASVEHFVILLLAVTVKSLQQKSYMVAILFLSSSDLLLCCAMFLFSLITLLQMQLTWVCGMAHYLVQLGFTTSFVQTFIICIERYLCSRPRVMIEFSMRKRKVMTLLNIGLCSLTLGLPYMFTVKTQTIQSCELFHVFQENLNLSLMPIRCITFVFWIGTIVIYILTVRNFRNAVVRIERWEGRSQTRHTTLSENITVSNESDKQTSTMAHPGKHKEEVSHTGEDVETYRDITIHVQSLSEAEDSLSLNKKIEQSQESLNAECNITPNQGPSKIHLPSSSENKKLPNQGPSKEFYNKEPREIISSTLDPLQAAFNDRIIKTHDSPKESLDTIPRNMIIPTSTESVNTSINNKIIPSQGPSNESSNTRLKTRDISNQSLSKDRIHSTFIDEIQCSTTQGSVKTSSTPTTCYTTQGPSKQTWKIINKAKVTRPRKSQPPWMARREVFRIVSVFFVVFLLSMTPQSVTGLTMIFMPIPESVVFGCKALAVSSVLTNPLLYTFLFKDFRKVILRCKACQ